MTLRQHIAKARWSRYREITDIWDIDFAFFLTSKDPEVVRLRHEADERGRHEYERERRGPYKGPAQASYRDAKGRLWVECSECDRGGNGGEKDKCSCGWKVTHPGQLGCFLGTLRPGITEGVIV